MTFIQAVSVRLQELLEEKDEKHVIGEPHSITVYK